VPGVLGLHIEGPHLNPAKKGIHDQTRFAAIDAQVIERLGAPTRAPHRHAGARAGPQGAIAALTLAGVLVCAGHSMADYAQTRAALAEGWPVSPISSTP
jgi:N-acetylglucosamine-6-phosphate deacetylase